MGLVEASNEMNEKFDAMQANIDILNKKMDIILTIKDEEKASKLQKENDVSIVIEKEQEEKRKAKKKESKSEQKPNLNKKGRVLLI